MTPLLFAVAIAGSTGFLSPNPNAQADAFAAACAPLMDHTVAPDGTPFRKLNELPPGIYERAVWRVVNGCPVREVVYKGQAYYIGPSIPRLDARPLTGGRLTRQYHSIEPIAPNPDAQGKTP
jgi:hypothetical protein